jgi:hypothetical protein
MRVNSLVKGFDPRTADIRAEIAHLKVFTKQTSDSLTVMKDKFLDSLKLMQTEQAVDRALLDSMKAIDNNVNALKNEDNDIINYESALSTIESVYNIATSAAASLADVPFVGGSAEAVADGVANMAATVARGAAFTKELVEKPGVKFGVSLINKAASMYRRMNHQMESAAKTTLPATTQLANLATAASAVTAAHAMEEHENVNPSNQFNEQFEQTETMGRIQRYSHPFFIKVMTTINIPLVEGVTRGFVNRLKGVPKDTLTQIFRNVNQVPTHVYCVMNWPLEKDKRDSIIFSTGAFETKLDHFKAMLTGKFFKSNFVKYVRVQHDFDPVDKIWKVVGGLSSIKGDLPNFKDAAPVETGDIYMPVGGVKEFLDCMVKLAPGYNLLAYNCQHQTNEVIDFITATKFPQWWDGRCAINVFRAAALQKNGHGVPGRREYGHGNRDPAHPNPMVHSTTPGTHNLAVQKAEIDAGLTSVEALFDTEMDTHGSKIEAVQAPQVGNFVSF